MGVHRSLKYLKTQPDEVRYITRAIYNLHFMISQIIPAQGKHLDLNCSFNQDSVITLTKFSSQTQIPWP